MNKQFTWGKKRMTKDKNWCSLIMRETQILNDISHPAYSGKKKMAKRTEHEQGWSKATSIHSLSIYIPPAILQYLVKWLAVWSWINHQTQPLLSFNQYKVKRKAEMVSKCPRICHMSIATSGQVLNRPGHACSLNPDARWIFIKPSTHQQDCVYG